MVRAAARVATDEAPEWLLVMRTITGMTETPGDADNPKILAMRDVIATTWPDMADYCDEYQHDATPWCGLAAAYCMTMAGIRPPFGKTDTDRWMWALAWADDDAFGTVLDAPVLGCVVVMERSGGGHVTLYESTSGSSYKCRGGNQSDAVTLASYPISGVVALVWPKMAGPVPPAARRELKKGCTGSDVAALQTSLGIPADGDFGAITETQVKAFQAACGGLDVDGVVGPSTWEQVDALDARMASGGNGLTADLEAEIIALAQSSRANSISWQDRGGSPPGYIAGMACVFALAAIWLRDAVTSAVGVMAAADSDDEGVDALSWYADKFAALHMDNSRDGIDTLRHLFVLQIGLGMRESSGKYCEGRDMSASNTSADTAEAGLFQTSWNINTADRSIPDLAESYWDNPNGFRPTFAEGISPTANNLSCYGTGAGARYQWLSRFSPAYHAMVTAVGLRTRRNHWGPINRYEVQLKQEVDDLLLAVQGLIEQEPAPSPEPEPEPGPEVATVNITTTGKVNVVVNGEPVWSGV